jgi:acyl-coenzyme A thioesterase 1/2/4
MQKSCHHSMSNMKPSSIEKHIEVVSFSESHPDVFKNQHELWRPGSRGIFGGIAIAQSLHSAQLTVPTGFDVHSMHCSFVFAGNAEELIEYHVERVRDGRSFCTRLVRAIQGNSPIFLASISFNLRQSRNVSRGLVHSASSPAVMLDEGERLDPSQSCELSSEAPYINRSAGVLRGTSRSPQNKRIHQWIRARGEISVPPGDPIHLAALAFMSDSYFLAAVPHSHEKWDFVQAPVTEFYPTKKDQFTSPKTHTAIRRPHLETGNRTSFNVSPKVAMMVSLDHTIYFHRVEGLRVDEWLLSEVHTSWAGNGRGLVHQKIWTKDGVLVATCIQEVSF